MQIMTYGYNSAPHFLRNLNDIRGRVKDNVAHARRVVISESRDSVTYGS
jgi:hypothetical protein